LFSEIFHKEGVDIEGRMLTRDAARGIIFQHGKLLMVFSEKNGDYKFPGGGVEKGEDQPVALIREVKEETGVEVIRVGPEFGCIIEYDIPIENEYDVFKMTSRYFMCEIGVGSGKQNLDEYEKDLGFTARWVNLEEALQTNRALLRERPSGAPQWIKREIFVLEQIKNSRV